MKAFCLGVAVLLLGGPLLPAGVLAQASPQEAQEGQEGQHEEQKSIFRRFALKRTLPNSEQVLFELPVWLRPQTDPGAETEMSLGVRYVTSLAPESRVYLSRSLGFAAVRWNPSPESISEVSVTTADFSVMINTLYRSFLVTSLGLGLGLMDGLIVYTDSRNFETRLELFLPIQFGVAWRLGENWQVGLKAAQYAFLRGDPVISITTVLLGVGYAY